ncbi:transcription initiation factor TFIID subunit 6-like isoform X1 [Gossypium australe]|uniref:Transcription initiation factor TFIID subunit 6-like isoform X1 n=1 Tax=Gossypium australe TaxID=47621 RepID=A0A5B6U456_9ROSI|nr:transcription initiation factor TFIID subunit 6-like isoform X1 [Gossypium australe]
MSNVPKEAIEVIAQSIGITNLSPDVALALAPDVEYRVREIMQEAIKCMRHSRRTVLTADDVDSALNLRNVEPICGFASRDALRFKKAAGHKDLFYIDDKDVEFKEVLESPLPKAPLDTSVTSHWLAIEGIQPAIPENASIEAPSDGKKAEYKEDGLSVDVKLPVKHVLSRELQLYFDKIVDITMNKSVSILFKQALLSLATDSGLHPLVPYFTYFIADEVVLKIFHTSFYMCVAKNFWLLTSLPHLSQVARNLNNFPLMFALMRVARSLVQNEHLHIEPYLHQLMPSIITCLVAKRLGNKFTDNHWELRNLAAKLVASICKRFGHVYHNLQPRVTRTLLHAFLDPTKTFPQHYGAIQGLAALGPSVVRLLILPNLEAYLQLLEPEIKRHEAWCVYGALLRAAGLCMYDRLKMFPSLLAPPTRPVWKSSNKVATNKRKASTDTLMQQQPPAKKIATESAIGMMPINSMQTDLQGAVSGFSTSVGGSNIGVSSMSRPLSNDNMLGREVGGRVSKTSTVLAQAWKEDTDPGNLLASLFELFGESMLSFTPKPELSFFL